MSQFAKQYREFFNETEAGQTFMTILADLMVSEQAKASDATDMQESFAYTQRAKGVQLAISKANSLMTEMKKPK